MMHEWLNGLRIGFVCNSASLFLSHFAELGTRVSQAGGQLTVIAPDDGRASDIRALGFRFIAVSMSRSGLNPLRECLLPLNLARVYRRHRLQMVHHVTAKAVIAGSLGARYAGQVAVVNTISGLGYPYAHPGRSALLRRLVSVMYRVSLNAAEGACIFENEDDRALLSSCGVRCAPGAPVIPGTGVDCDTFRPAPPADGVPVFAFVGRALRDKGILEFAHAAKELRASGLRAAFAVVGRVDPGNPTSLTTGQLESLCQESGVECRGFRDDMAQAMREISCLVLPSFREGFPRVIQEAAATGIPTVTSDAPGCRSAVVDGRTGMLVPVRDSGGLARAIRMLALDAELRQQMGHEARQHALLHFRSKDLCRAIMNQYRLALRV